MKDKFFIILFIVLCGILMALVINFISSRISSRLKVEGAEMVINRIFFLVENKECEIINISKGEGEDKKEVDLVDVDCIEPE